MKPLEILNLDIAIIGLGSMGYGIASSCLRAGHTVWGVDISPEQTTKFCDQGGESSSFSEAVSRLDAVAIVVLNAVQTETVLFGGDGIVKHLKAGCVVVACATVSPLFAKDMEARCSQFGVHYLDAPISGGSVKAANGQLSIMASGTPEAFSFAGPLLDSISETVFKLGNEAGPGSAMKSVNQLLAGVHIAVMAEALTFGMTQGVTPEKFVEVISKCAGSSWMLENRAPHIVDGDYTAHSSVNIWPKDLGIVLDVANSTNFDAPITTAALQQFVTAAEMGFGNEDDSAVAKVYAKNAGLTLPNKV